MKIISGKYKGRILKGFDIKGTRPTMDRVKESVFAMIQDYIKDSTVLDLYSGSGNLGIESLSNGAKKAYLVDNNKIAINTINENIKALNISNVRVIKDDAINVLDRLLKEGIKLDIIFLDPPYETNELDKVLTKINNKPDLLQNQGLIICETTLNIDYSKYENLEIYKERKFGEKNIFILKMSKKCKLI